MKIIFILPYPNPFQGGAGWIRISYFGQYLAKKGHSVTIAGVFSMKSLQSAGFSTWNNLRITNIIPSILINNAFALILNIFSSLIMSLILFAFYRPDVLVISVPNGDIGFGSFIAAKILRIPKIYFDYRDNWEEFALRILSKGAGRAILIVLARLMGYCYERSNGVIAVTPDLVDQLKARNIKNFFLITNGADLDIFRPRPKGESRSKLGLNDGDFIIVHSGLIGAYYKLDTILKALRQMKLQTIKLIIIGSGSDLPRILKIVEDYGLKENVYYRGSIYEPSTIAEILSACDVGLVPYDRHEMWHNITGALPVKVFEFSACALPLIATTSEDTLLGKFIKTNNIGMISNPDDVNGLVKNIIFLYKNIETLNDMSKRALSLVTDKYDRKKKAQHLFELMEG